MKKLLVLVTFLVFAFSAVCFAEVIKNKTNLKKEAKTTAEVIKELEPGTEYTVKSEQGIWKEITTSTGDTGWISLKTAKHETKSHVKKTTNTEEKTMVKKTETKKDVNAPVGTETKPETTQPTTK